MAACFEFEITPLAHSLTQLLDSGDDGEFTGIWTDSRFRCITLQIKLTLD